MFRCRHCPSRKGGMRAGHRNHASSFGLGSLFRTLGEKSTATTLVPSDSSFSIGSKFTRVYSANRRQGDHRQPECSELRWRALHRQVSPGHRMLACPRNYPQPFSASCLAADCAERQRRRGFDAHVSAPFRLFNFVYRCARPTAPISSGTARLIGRRYHVTAVKAENRIGIANR